MRKKLITVAVLAAVLLAFAVSAYAKVWYGLSLPMSSTAYSGTDTRTSINYKKCSNQVTVYTFGDSSKPIYSRGRYGNARASDLMSHTGTGTKKAWYFEDYENTKGDYRLLVENSSITNGARVEGYFNANDN